MTQLLHAESLDRLLLLVCAEWQRRARGYLRKQTANLADKRGVAFQKMELEVALGVAHGKDVDLVALDDALQTLAAFAPHRSRAVGLRYFGKLTIEKTAEFLKSSCVTVKPDWSIARAWLFNEG